MWWTHPHPPRTHPPLAQPCPAPCLPSCLPARPPACIPSMYILSCVFIHMHERVTPCIPVTTRGAPTVRVAGVGAARSAAGGGAPRCRCQTPNAGAHAPSSMLVLGPGAAQVAKKEAGGPGATTWASTCPRAAAITHSHTLKGAWLVPRTQRMRCCFGGRLNCAGEPAGAASLGRVLPPHTSCAPGIGYHAVQLVQNSTRAPAACCGAVHAQGRTAIRQMRLAAHAVGGGRVGDDGARPVRGRGAATAITRGSTGECQRRVAAHATDLAHASTARWAMLLAKQWGLVRASSRAWHACTLPCSASGAREPHTWTPSHGERLAAVCEGQRDKA